MFFTVLNSTLIVNIKNGTGILQKGNPNDYYVAYWDRNHWCRATKEIYCTTDPIMPEKVMYHIDSLPSQAIYILFDKRTGLTYHRRIFRVWAGEPTRL